MEVDRDCPASARLPEAFVRRTKRLLLSLTPGLRKVDWKVASSEAGFRTRKLE
jgi:hypothetical protein